MLTRIKCIPLTETTRISKLVSAAEKRLNKKTGKYCIRTGRGLTWFTQAPNQGVYESSDLFQFTDFLKELHFSGSSVAVLGGGLKGSSLILSLFFKNIVAWEADENIYAAAKNMGTDLGFPYDSIDFRLGDFLEKDRSGSYKISIAEFDAIYFFKPFNKTFSILMGERLSTARKGAMIISPSLGLPPTALMTIYSKERFRLISNGKDKKFGFQVFEKIS